MHPILDRVCDRLGDPPRNFRRDEWPDLVIPEPAWAADDDIRVIFRDQRFLYEEGEVVWGAFVQANNVLSRPGPGNHPGTLIYCRHPDVDDDPGLLLDIARRLGRLKEEASDDPDEERYGRMLADEMKRAMRWRAPETLTDGLPVYSTSVMVCRRHIPGRILVRTHVPILRHRDTVATLIVPHRFWPRPFREEWAVQATEMAARWPEWVRVTDRAADRASEIARDGGVQRWCVRVWIDRSADGTRQSVRLDLDQDFDDVRDRLFQVSGVTVAMARQQADELRGIEIDYFDDGRQRGFVVG
jgi:Fe-S cluster assembly iron-binding protein IscA